MPANFRSPLLTSSFIPHAISSIRSSNFIPFVSAIFSNHCNKCGVSSLLIPTTSWNRMSGNFCSFPQKPHSKRNLLTYISGIVVDSSLVFAFNCSCVSFPNSHGLRWVFIIVCI